MSDQLAFPFEGETYVSSLDRERLGEQLLRVIDLMADCQWRSLREIASITDDPEASVSARLRDIRKLWGTDAMESRRRPSVDARRGLWEYRVHIALASDTNFGQVLAGRES
jgi:hypothetical protein